jgi:hypothetical protein
MAYVQMSLLGMAGYVIIGNSLIPSENYDVWFTPMYFLYGFNYRKQKRVEVLAEPVIDVAPVMIQQPEIIVPAVDADITIKEAANGQFQLVF